VTRTLRSLARDAGDALVTAGLTDPDWTLAEVVSAESTQSGLVVGDLGWRAQRLRFACVDRSIPYRLVQHDASLQPGLSCVFSIRLVIHPRYGFRAEVHDVDLASIRCDDRGEV